MELYNKEELPWLGHLLRLDEKTPAKKGIAEYLNKVKKKCGSRKAY